MGAMLHASSKLHRVYAPSTHSIPVLYSIPNPYGAQTPAEISIFSCGSRIRLLKQIAPKFGRIWNGKPVEKNDKSSPMILTNRSFENVRIGFDHKISGPSDLVDRCNLRQTTLIDDRCMHYNLLLIGIQRSLNLCPQKTQDHQLLWFVDRKILGNPHLAVC